MSVYTGWQKDLLTVASLPNTAQNRAFLSAWHTHAESDCKLNPIDLTEHNSHSQKCKEAGRAGVSYQAYDDRVWTRTAFHAQLDGGDYPHLLAALQSGNPYTVSNPADVTNDLSYWQSFTFANTYLDQATAGPPVVKPTAPHALGGWKALRKSINKGMPDALGYSQRLNRQTLRSLARARKVRL